MKRPNIFQRILQRIQIFVQRHICDCDNCFFKWYYENEVEDVHNFKK